jgi:sterol desaturase/sphingolipid hydroxylase (fatty acid hydroxylase superfamily)
LGLRFSPGATALLILLNVKTPHWPSHWLGYIFQRPESHCIHHQEGVHAFNYSDLPMWDMFFGTYRNPLEWEGRCGFGPADEFRLAEMLRGMDIHQTDIPKVNK